MVFLYSEEKFEAAKRNRNAGHATHATKKAPLEETTKKAPLQETARPVALVEQTDSVPARGHDASTVGVEDVDVTEATGAIRKPTSARPGSSSSLMYMVAFVVLVLAVLAYVRVSSMSSMSSHTSRFDGYDGGYGLEAYRRPPPPPPPPPSYPELPGPHAYLR